MSCIACSKAGSSTPRQTGDGQGIEFIESLNEPFYGGRQFGIRDLNGFQSVLH